MRFTRRRTYYFPAIKGELIASVVTAAGSPFHCRILSILALERWTSGEVLETVAGFGRREAVIRAADQMKTLTWDWQEYNATELAVLLSHRGFVEPSETEDLVLGVFSHYASFYRSDRFPFDILFNLRWVSTTFVLQVLEICSVRGLNDCLAKVASLARNHPNSEGLQEFLDRVCSGVSLSHSDVLVISHFLGLVQIKKEDRLVEELKGIAQNAERASVLVAATNVLLSLGETVPDSPKFSEITSSIMTIRRLRGDPFAAEWNRLLNLFKMINHEQYYSRIEIASLRPSIEVLCETFNASSQFLAERLWLVTRLCEYDRINTLQIQLFVNLAMVVSKIY